MGRSRQHRARGSSFPDAHAIRSNRHAPEDGMASSPRGMTSRSCSRSVTPRSTTAGSRCCLSWARGGAKRSGRSARSSVQQMAHRQNSCRCWMRRATLGRMLIELIDGIGSHPTKSDPAPARIEVAVRRRCPAVSSAPEPCEVDPDLDDRRSPPCVSRPGRCAGSVRSGGANRYLNSRSRAVTELRRRRPLHFEARRKDYRALACWHPHR